MKKSTLLAVVALLSFLIPQTGWGQTYSLATSLSVGDEVVLVNTGVTKELGSLTTSGTIYGTAVDVANSTPVGSNLLTVAAGSAEGSFAFKTSDDKYLSWSSGNSLTTADDVTDASSWTITFDDEGNATVANVGTTARILSYNSSSPRFACYGNMNQQRVRFYKKESAASDAPSITADNVNIAYDAEEGVIAYTIENEVEGGSVNATTTADWLTLGENFESPIAFTCSANEGGERTATVTLTYSYGDSESVTKNVTVTQAGNPNAPGTENNPYTVAEALANTPASGTSANVYVRGIVSRFQKDGGGIMDDGNNFRYYISDDGTTTSEIQVYRGKGLNNVAFSNNNDLLVGDEVVICGGLTTYNTTKEIAANNYIVSLNRPTPTDPTVTVNPTAVEVDAAEHDGTITVSCENMGENLDISVFFCEETDVTAPADYDWIDAEIDDQNNVYYVIEANTATEARTAYMVVKVADADAKEVYTSKLITFTQAGKELPSVTWNLSIDETATATTTEMSWTSDYATMLVEKAGSSTNTNNYYPGSATPRTSTRFYTSSELTIAPKPGYTITKVEFTATSANYASALSNSTWTNATAAVDGTNVTVTPTNGNLAIVATIGGTCGFTGVTVYYEESNVVTIEIKKDFTATTFSCDKALDFSNMEITAFIITDENGTTAEVTKVPANTGIYVEGAEGNYEVPILADETEADVVTGNKLIPTVAGETLVSNDEFTYYAYGKQKGTEAFFKISTDTAKGLNQPANKAVLAIEAAAGAKDVIFVNGDVTGIDSIDNEQPTNSRYFTVDGKLVKGQPTQKGIYIVNGRKVVIK